MWLGWGYQVAFYIAWISLLASRQILMGQILHHVFMLVLTHSWFKSLHLPTERCDEYHAHLFSITLLKQLRDINRLALSPFKCFRKEVSFETRWHRIARGILIKPHHNNVMDWYFHVVSFPGPCGSALNVHFFHYLGVTGGKRLAVCKLMRKWPYFSLDLLNR